MTALGGDNPRRERRKGFLARLVVGSTAVIAAAVGVTVGLGIAEGIDENTLRTHALVTWYDVSAPAGKFLLIRRDASVCAIRFIDYQRGNDAKAPTLFSSGEESFYAKYECFCQGDGGGGFGDATIGELSKRPLWGIGRLAFQRGETNVRCGRFKLPWSYPTRVSFQPYGSKLGDHGIELAPTRWTDIKDVNVNDNRLQWFHYDEGRKVTLIRSEDL
jgi:hypothetical protein